MRRFVLVAVVVVVTGVALLLGASAASPAGSGWVMTDLTGERSEEGEDQRPWRARRVFWLCEGEGDQ